MQHLCWLRSRYLSPPACQARVSSALAGIKQHAPPQCEPRHSFEFQPCDCSFPGGAPKTFAPAGRRLFIPSTIVTGTTEVSNPVAPWLSHLVEINQCSAFAPVLRYQRISPLHRLSTPLILKQCGFGRSSSVGPRDFTSDLHRRLRALYAQ